MSHIVWGMSFLPVPAFFGGTGIRKLTMLRLKEISRPKPRPKVSPQVNVHFFVVVPFIVFGERMRNRFLASLQRRVLFRKTCNSAAHFIMHSIFHSLDLSTNSKLRKPLRYVLM